MTTVQIRNVSEETSRALKAKAASEGRSLSDYLLGHLDRIAQQPTRAELWQRIDTRGRVALSPAADMLSAARGER